MTDQDKLKKYQNNIMEMLVAFRDFCKENKLVWLLAGGSSLGAVRHSGFIPWDDDVDLAMPREDFEKLESIMRDNDNRLGRFIYSPVDAQIIPDAPIGHLYYTKENESQNLQAAPSSLCIHAPKLDIHVLDGVPEEKSKRARQKRKSLIYYLGIYHLPVKNKGKIIRMVSKILLGLISDKSWKSIERKSKAYFTSWSCSNSKYICSIFGAAGYEKETVPREWLLPPKEDMFNGETMPVPAKTDKYLERLYGDWRKLPPEEERHPVHDHYKYYD